MNSIVPPDTTEEPDLIDRIANALPDKVRSDYYRELMHCRSLPENDEMLRLLRAMPFLTLLIQVPAGITDEREKLDRLFGSAMQKVQEDLNSCMAYQKLLYERLIRRPGQLKTAFNPEPIVADINESLRQQFLNSTIPETAEALAQVAEKMKETNTEFEKTAGTLSDSYRGVAEQVRQSIDGIRSSISQASNAAQTAANELSSAFLNEYRGTLCALCFLALLIGMTIGVLFQRWRDPEPNNEIQIEAPPVTPAPLIKKKT